MVITITKEEVFAACAVIGAVLGVVNLYRGLRVESERVRLRVRTGASGELNGIEVRNNSIFAVNVVKLGAVDRDGRVSDVALEIFTTKADNLPARIDARTALFFRVSRREADTRRGRAPKFYFATTALGRLHTSEGGLRRRWRRALELVRIRKKLV